MFNAKGKEQQKSSTGRVATGYTIAVYDETGALVEEFYIVIFGDVNQDGYVNNADATMIKNETVRKTSWSRATSDSYMPRLVRAANVNGDAYVNNSDSTAVSAYAVRKVTINQTTGRAS